MRPQKMKDLKNTRSRMSSLGSKGQSPPLQVRRRIFLTPSRTPSKKSFPRLSGAPSEVVLVKSEPEMVLVTKSGEPEGNGPHSLI